MYSKIRIVVNNLLLYLRSLFVSSYLSLLLYLLDLFFVSSYLNLLLYLLNLFFVSCYLNLSLYLPNLFFVSSYLSLCFIFSISLMCPFTPIFCFIFSISFRFRVLLPQSFALSFFSFESRSLKILILSCLSHLLCCTVISIIFNIFCISFSHQNTSTLLLLILYFFFVSRYLSHKIFFLQYIVLKQSLFALSSLFLSLFYMSNNCHI